MWATARDLVSRSQDVPAASAGPPLQPLSGGIVVELRRATIWRMSGLQQRDGPGTSSAARWSGARRDSCALVATLLLGLPTTSMAQSWNTLPDLLEARQEIAGAVLGEALIVVGGFAIDGSALASAESYSPGAAAWVRLPDMPLGVHHPAAAVVNGMLIVIGGFAGGGLDDATDAVQIYDPAAGTWRLGAPMPAARGGLAAVAVAGGVMVVGGADQGRSFADLRVYDPGTDIWTELPSMPTARDHLAVAILDGLVHATGGRNQQSFTLAVHEVYDPASSNWSTMAPLPTGRSGHAAAVLGGCLYALGGEGNSTRADGLFPEVERFDPSADAWTSLEPMPTPRHGMSAIAIDGRIVVVGGADEAGFGALSVVEEFAPASCE